jgi:glycerol kinase
MVSNDWFLAFLAGVVGLPVERPKNVESTALGAAYLAGLQSGVYSSTDEIASFWESDAIFEPEMDAQLRAELYAGWKNAVGRVRS